MIRLIATDLDGTLLDSAGHVPPPNRLALARAVDSGVRLVLATARKLHSTRAVAELLALPCALIMHNGARTHDWSGAERRHYRLESELAHKIASFADDRGVGLIVTVDEANYYGGAARALGREADDSVVATNRDALVGRPTRIIAVGSAGIDLLCEEFAGAADSVVVHRYYSRIGALESAVLTHPRATKADALAELCAAFGIAREEVIAFGDAEADADMLRWAGIGVAMGNAMEETRAAADWIAPTHDAAGLAAGLARFVDR